VSDWEILQQESSAATSRPWLTACPATGKQYLVIAAGGHPKITEEKLGDSLSAFALP